MMVPIIQADIVGISPLQVNVGAHVTTWFLSMRISNTAATSMMIPIIQAVIIGISPLQVNVGAHVTYVVPIDVDQ